MRGAGARRGCVPGPRDRAPSPRAPPWPRLWKGRVRGRSRSAANAPWRRVSLRCPPGNAAAEVTDGRRCCSGGRPCCRPSSGLRRPVRGRPELPPADPGGCCPRGVGTFPVLRGAWSCCIGKCRWCRRVTPGGSGPGLRVLGSSRASGSLLGGDPAALRLLATSVGGDKYVMSRRKEKGF